MTRPRIEPRSPGPLVNTLHSRPMSLIGSWKKYLSKIITAEKFKILLIMAVDRWFVFLIKMNNKWLACGRYHWPALKDFFQKFKCLTSDIWSPFYAELKNPIHCLWSGLVFKMCLTTSQQVIHNNNIYSKTCGLMADAWSSVLLTMLYVYLTIVHHPTLKHFK